MINRTEEQKLSKAPLEFAFGDKKYEVKFPNIRAAARWREFLVEKLSTLTTGRVAPDQVLRQVLTVAWCQYPTIMQELVFKFSDDLPKEEILDNATDEQMLIALECIMDITVRPFTAQMGSLMQATRANLGQQSQ